MSYAMKRWMSYDNREEGVMQFVPHEGGNWVLHADVVASEIELQKAHARELGQSRHIEALEQRVTELLEANTRALMRERYLNGENARRAEEADRARLDLFRAREALRAIAREARAGRERKEAEWLRCELSHVAMLAERGLLRPETFDILAGGN